jgi:hypothetical protein
MKPQREVALGEGKHVGPNKELQTQGEEATWVPDDLKDVNFEYAKLCYIIIKKLRENQKQQLFIAHSKVFATDPIVGETCSPPVIASVSGHPLVVWLGVLWAAALQYRKHTTQILSWISRHEVETIICN